MERRGAHHVRRRVTYGGVSGEGLSSTECSGDSAGLNDTKKPDIQYLDLDQSRLESTVPIDESASSSDPFGSGTSISQGSFSGQDEPPRQGLELFPAFQEADPDPDPEYHHQSDAPWGRAEQDNSCFGSSPISQGFSLLRSQTADYPKQNNHHTFSDYPVGRLDKRLFEGKGKEPTRSPDSICSFLASGGQRRITWSTNCKDPQPLDRTRTALQQQNTSYHESPFGFSEGHLPVQSLNPETDENERDITDRYSASFSSKIYPRSSESLRPANHFQHSSSQLGQASPGNLALPEIHIPPSSAPPYDLLRPYNSCHASRSTSPKFFQHSRRNLSDTFPLGFGPFKKRHRESKSLRVISGGITSAIKDFLHDHTKHPQKKFSSDELVPLNPANIPRNFRFDGLPRRKNSSRSGSKKQKRLYSSDQVHPRQSGFPIEHWLDPRLDSTEPVVAGVPTSCPLHSVTIPVIPYNHPSHLRFAAFTPGEQSFSSSNPETSPQDILGEEHCLFAQSAPRISSHPEFVPPRTPDHHDTMASSRRDSELPNRSSAMAAVTRHKAEAMRLAREQGAAVKEMCRRTQTDVPPYEFEELIGKGAYGRVYKGRHHPTRSLVAIKVMDVDSVDYMAMRDFKDESIKDFIHESKVMTQVRDAGASNVNALIEAISLNTQLWLVCEYCPGGSVRTLMRATGDKLEERFIIPIARGLAEGLRAIHAAGVIHRDVKAANVLIHEEGRLQICDFGVAGVLQSQLDKRSTWIGTPHWMPPEMFSARSQAHQYGSEIDVWAYGCTLFEFATGSPPNSNLRERMQIGRQLSRSTPKLAGEKHSDELKDLVSYSLDSNPDTRPSMADILSHPYIANTADEYPTSSLSELVKIYYQWSQGGGQRASLFHPGGAAPAELPALDNSVDNDWNFSTTDNFERRHSVIDLNQLAASLAELEAELTPTQASPERAHFEPASDTELNSDERANFDERVERGAAALEGLFDESKPSYQYETKNDFVPVENRQQYSDLPLRNDTDRSSVMSTFIDIDIGSFDSSHYAAGTTSAQPFQLVDADTIRATRSSGRSNCNSNEERPQSSRSSAGKLSDENSQDNTYQPQSGPRPPTMEWSFPSFMRPPSTEGAETGNESDQPAQEAGSESTDKRATMEWTFPVMTGEEGEGDAGDAEPNRFSTLKGPVAPPSEEPAALRTRDSIGEPGDSESVSEEEAADDDPFRFDGLQTPPGVSADNDFPEMLDSGTSSDRESSVILDGPGPDEEDSNSVISRTASPGHHEIFSTAIPAKRESDEVRNNNGQSPPRSLSTVSLDHQHSAVPDPLRTARRLSPPSAISTTTGDLSNNGVRENTNAESIQFPDIMPPNLESLTEGADSGVMTTELDRLLGDFLGALSATGDALSRVGTSPDWGGTE